MKLEYANLICPKCGNGNYMRHLVGENVGEINLKRINCNSYFKLSDFYRMEGKAEPKPITNSDRIRGMSDEELAEFITNTDFCELLCAECPICKDGRCDKKMLDWLKQEDE